MKSIILHASGVACFGYALYYDLFRLHVPTHMASSAVVASLRAFPGKWKYLTVWDIVLQLVYHSVSLLNDVVGTSEIAPKRQSPLQRLRDGLFASWAFPVGLFVSGTFWGLYAIDRALVFPKEMDLFYPYWLNHAAHTGPFIFMTLELFSTPKLLPTRSCSLIANLGFSAVYLSCVTFWAMFFLDRELVFPKLIDTFFPTWLNHAVHTAPSVYVLCESVLVRRTYPHRLVGVAILIGGVTLYLSWITWVYSLSGVWAYPILQMFNNVQRGVFFGGCCLLIVGLYFVGDKLSQWRWGTSEDSPTTAKSTSARKGNKKAKLT